LSFLDIRITIFQQGVSIQFDQQGWSMDEIGLDFHKVLFEDLDPDKVPQRFLKLLLRLENVERGSIWVREKGQFLCIASLGNPLDPDITGVTISASQPSVVGWVINHEEMTIAEPGKDARHHGEFEEGLALKSTRILCFPLILSNGQVYGAVQLIDTTPGGNRLNVNERFLDVLKSVVDSGAVALSNALQHTKQVERNLELERTLEEISGKVQVIGQSTPFLHVMKKVREYARTDYPVLVTGESGTGKDLIALALHELSSRNDKPFVVQNCAAIPETLLESELFGYKRGAFTGANQDKIGLLKAADGGTVFLDEIGDMSSNLQSRLLRVIQNSEVKPVGETRTIKVDVRVISATNKDLGKAIAKGEFRQDLFHRINVLPLPLPSLRKRRNDIPLLLNYFLKRESNRLGIMRKRFSTEALAALEDYLWPGNIRELENFVKYVLSTVDGVVVGVSDIPDHVKASTHRAVGPVESGSASQELALAGPSHKQGGGGPPFAGYTWRELEKAYALYLLEKNKWNVTRAAKEAQLNRSTFDSRLKKLGIRKE
jgi:transcriptional regulator with GAF, ATPase, and Fis domain